MLKTHEMHMIVSKLEKFKIEFLQKYNVAKEEQGFQLDRGIPEAEEERQSC